MAAGKHAADGDGVEGVDGEGDVNEVDAGGAHV